MTPDWNYNLGRADETLRDLAGKTPASLIPPAPLRLPPAKGRDEQLQVIETAVGMPNNSVRRVRTPGRLEDVVIRKDYLPHLVKKQRREQWANYILPALEDPLEVWRSPVKNRATGKIVYRRWFITLFDEAGKIRGTLAVVQENKDGSLLWTFFSSKDFKYIDKQRHGFLLYRKQAGR